MELKDRYKLLLKMFDAKDDEHFSDTINRVNNSAKRNDYFEKYLEVFDDLSKDELRGCWQFWCCKRFNIRGIINK